jgi:hypothetical protein
VRLESQLYGDCSRRMVEFKASLGYRARPCLKKKKKIQFNIFLVLTFIILVFSTKGDYNVFSSSLLISAFGRNRVGS